MRDSELIEATHDGSDARLAGEDGSEGASASMSRSVCCIMGGGGMMGERSCPRLKRAGDGDWGIAGDDEGVTDRRWW